MSTIQTSEAAFESVIEADLLAAGYHVLPAAGYRPGRALFEAEVLDFIARSQPREWAKLGQLLGDRRGEQVLEDLARWLDQQGCLATLRHGFKCYGRLLRVAYFRPAHGLNDELSAQYTANRPGITRQLHYGVRDHGPSLDLVLSLNGLPVATLELKNPYTGQTAADAVRQYRHDRDPRELLFEFKRRALVHFAVDPDIVWMTTRLAGEATRFLPFNRGDAGGAGNPPDLASGQHRTAYLWQHTLRPDSLLELLGSFLHLQTEEQRGDDGRRVKKETLVFPRYHQLDAVRQLVAAARQEGPGHNYLIEHSAGSGKSNTIAWLAHQLASLHDAQERRVFDTVVVVTDRRVLDQQLQDTIYQFEHRLGVVQKIDEDSAQLAEALVGGVPIVITTLQKFPYVTRQLAKLAEQRSAATPDSDALPGRRYAVLVDEAHSSQGGDAATELKGVLGGTELRAEARRRAQEEGQPNLEKLYQDLAKRGRQPNLSFFAFTATPKGRTVAVFGRGGQPFHRYVMRQAIEEEFIVDVLRHYATYAAYYKLLKVSANDPYVVRRPAAHALSRYLRLHPANVAQKTAVIVEHFEHVVRHRLGGRAKAMVVTSSRLDAVRYKQSFDQYIREKRYPIKSLVAFSGAVPDPELPGVSYTEPGMNGGLPEKALPEAFATPDYQVLLVAEKYQTGFDQPLLHTLYVDRRLDGIQAVQTLSRLNRPHPLKEDTFVLDFVNEPAHIQAAFAQYYEGATLGELPEAARLYELQATLDAAGIYHPEEVASFKAVFFKPGLRQSVADHRALSASLDPAMDRYRDLRRDEEALALAWRKQAQALLNLYSFLSQIIPYQESDLETLCAYLRHLLPRLPKRGPEATYAFDEEVRLQYFRLQKIGEGAIALHGEPATPLPLPLATGTATVAEEPLAFSRLVDIVNERFGTEFNEGDQLFFDQIAAVALRSDVLQQAAVANSAEKFALVFGSLLETLFIERMDQNVDIFSRYMSDGQFQEMVRHLLATDIYKQFRQQVSAKESVIMN
ncbi:MAG TPA: DEAD/DEAH box helicase family protein [Hymenobacter sp.]|uniref:type I restriction endonuclease subunit R n=1 Tax=Hymenobacter sp. TaxID=1898978 RepID=UPI002D7FBD03|nr:DEAD/DEAH box helicase family protein [Hymenobacter sp.]HET9505370.1 DEAD/DEAH box helicase family protein [Hymenobacter sp.]